MINYVNNHWIKFSDWPIWARRLALKPHKTHHQRFKFFCFLTKNGLEPHASANLVVCDEWWYDRSALTDLRELVAAVSDRHGRRFWSWWNVNIQQVDDFNLLHPRDWKYDGTDGHNLVFDKNTNKIIF